MADIAWMKVVMLISTLGTCDGERKYVLTAPRAFRPNTSYRFVVSTYDAWIPLHHLKAKIESPPSNMPPPRYTLTAKIESTSRDVLVEKEFSFWGYGLTTNEYFLRIPPQVPFGEYNFVAKTVGYVNFDIVRSVKVIRKTHSLFIQTDKYYYKPGQTVLFRVIAINSELMPLAVPINITIYDQADNRIYQLLRLRNVSGVINNQLKLSDITPLGKWRIEAKTEYLKEEVYFQVAEYVLPKFEVKVILPSYFFINRNNPSYQKNLQITTTATYTFGKPVKGFAYIVVRRNARHFGSLKHQIYKKVKLVDGKADISLTFTELKGMGIDNGVSLFVQANVTETATGIVLQGNNTVPVKSRRYKLEFLSTSSDNFKPGFFYRAYVQLSQVDKSAPLNSDIISIDGRIKSLKVDILFDDVACLMCVAKEMKVPLTSSGYVSFVFRTESKWANLKLRVTFDDSIANDTVTTYKYIHNFETRDKKYIQISLASESNVIKPNMHLNFIVETSEYAKVIQYQVLGKSGILRAGSLPEPQFISVKKFSKSDILRGASSVAHKETFDTRNRFQASHQNQTLRISDSPSESLIDLKLWSRRRLSIYFDRDLVVAAAPEAKIVVFYVTSTGELVTDSLALSVTDYFSNKVSLSFDPKSVSPGDEVLLNVSCSAGSYVSLLAVDQSVLLLGAGNDITKQMVSEDLARYSSNEISPWYYPIHYLWPRPTIGETPGALLKNAGLFVATNYYIHDPLIPIYYVRAPQFRVTATKFAVDSSKNSVKLDQEEVSKVKSPRKLFPETWIWSDLIAGNDGSIKLKYTVPDTITSWIATAFATHRTAGLGVTDTSAKVTVIKPFFISLNLPYSIIRGEQFALQVTVFNYFGQDLQVRVSLAKSNYYKVKKCLIGLEKEILLRETSRIVFVQNNDMVTVYFWIVAISLGQVPIEVKAVTGVAADSLIVNLLVKPEGQQQSYSSSSLIKLPPGRNTEVNFVLTFPLSSDLVSDSVIIEATLIGDILGTAVNNLDQLLKMPHGCGEQNMVTLAPDVYILKYLTLTNQLTEEIRVKALGFINQGYQRQLTYQRTDGSFSAFGNSDPAGSLWLSAFVVRVFWDAKDYIPVNTNKIGQTVQWILRQQTRAGMFVEPPNGKVMNSKMQGGTTSGITLTAYVAITLLKIQTVSFKLSSANLHKKTKLAISYLENHYRIYSKDPYVLCIVSYAFQLTGSSHLSNVLKLLEALATHEGGMTYWSNKAVFHKAPKVWTPPYSRPQSTDVEMTAYVLLTYASKNDLSKSIPIAKWLIKNRNAQGGFTSTQDTVLGLEALAAFGLLVVPPGNSQGLSVQVSQDATSDVHEFRTVNKETALLLQSVQLPSQTTKVKFLAQGEGLSVVQINVQYNVKSKQNSELITQTLSVTSNNTKLDLKICLKWSGTELSGMVLTEVNLLTGYVLSGGYEDVLKKDLGTAFKKQEYKNDALSVYLDGITSVTLCFTIKMESAFYVSKVKPALVKTYQYYSPGVVATGYYSPKSTSAVVNVCDPIFNVPSFGKNIENEMKFDSIFRAASFRESVKIK